MHTALFTPGRHGWSNILLWTGKPGNGKTAIVGELALESGIYPFYLIGATIEAPDIGGWPHPGEKHGQRCLDFLSPQWVIEANHICETTEYGVVIVADEINTSSPQVQGALLRVLNERVVGTVKLHERVRFMCFMNPPEIAIEAGGNPIAPALANRVGHLEWVEPTVQEFNTYMLRVAAGGKAPLGTPSAFAEAALSAVWNEFFVQASGDAAAFLSANAKRLSDHPKGSDALRQAYPTHRCYDADTDVLTRRGWVRWSEVVETDEFLTLAPDGTGVYQPPEELYSAQYSGDMFRVKSRYVDLLVTPGHKMYAAPSYTGLEGIRREKAGYDLMPIETVLGYLETPSAAVRFQSGMKWQGAAAGGKAVGTREVSWDVWAEFIGWWMTDGYCYIPKKQPSARIVAITQVNDENRGRIAELLVLLGCKKVCVYSDRVRAEDRELFDLLAPMGGKHAGGRRVPRDLMDQPESVLRSFIRGAAGGDGWMNGKTLEICPGVSKGFADDLQEIGLKLGGTSLVSDRPSASTGRAVYTVSFGGERYARPKLYAKNFTKERYSGMVYCARVAEHHTLMVRRNGKPVWSGNTWEDAIRALAAARYHRLESSEAWAYVGSFISEPVATEWRAYLQTKEIPDAADWLAGRVTLDLRPTRADVASAVLRTAVALLASTKEDGAFVDRCVFLIKWFIDNNVGYSDLVSGPMREMFTVWRDRLRSDAKLRDSMAVQHKKLIQDFKRIPLMARLEDLGVLAEGTAGR